MWNNFYKTISECQQRTPDTQKGNSISLKGCKAKIKDEKRGKQFKGGDPSWGGSREGGEVSTQ